ncbi:hypothetical protein VTL71DRAFT_4517 [Oculimacula yallundae]|uniref:Secreted protein n=1 Tax=Oculimacula yallundae TaxID=86028 RepID=A0ABR4C296_9HELO
MSAAGLLVTLSSLSTFARSDITSETNSEVETIGDKNSCSYNRSRHAMPCRMYLKTIPDPSIHASFMVLTP